MRLQPRLERHWGNAAEAACARRYVALFSGLFMATLVYGQVAKTTVTQSPPASGHEFVSRYCAACHNDKSKAGGFSFTQIDLAHPGQNAEQFEKVILKLRTGMMPPAGMPRPKADALNSFVTDLETRIDRAAAGPRIRGRLRFTG